MAARKTQAELDKDKEQNIKSNREENPTPNIMEWKQILKNRRLWNLLKQNKINID